MQLADCKTLGIALIISTGRRLALELPRAAPVAPRKPRGADLPEGATDMADAAPAEPEPELPFHERPQDLRQKGNDYEAYLKSTLGP